MNPDGTQVRQLTNSPHQDVYPTWSPDGTQILFERHDGGSGVFVVNAEGTHVRRVSPESEIDASGSWSPDGRKIIFTRVITMPPNFQTQLMVMNADGTNARVLLPSDGFYHIEPRWSPDGSKVVFMSNRAGTHKNHIYSMHADGTHIQQLTHEGDNGDPVWSPDGKNISFGSNREGGGRVNVYLMHPDGTNVRQLTHFPAPYEAGDTSWSSDGKKIAFEWDINGKGQSDPNAFAEIWIMSADGTNPVSTGQRCSAVGCSPRWRPAK